MTGPQMINIFAPTPVISPSVLNSTAGAATAFAKPVMGTSAPAPACLANFSYQPREVVRAERNISVSETDMEAVLRSSPAYS